MTETGRQFWDAQAETFDDVADHGLATPEVREAWEAQLLPVLPGAPARVADLGCGTGSISLLLADAGYDVVGADFSRQMVERAHAKAREADARVRLVQADVESVPLRPGSFDVVLCRHAVWAVRDIDAALGTWARLLRPDGMFVLVEGLWWTGVGLSADELAGCLRRHRRHVEIVPLDAPALWGGPVDDDRYLLVSRAEAVA